MLKHYNCVFQGIEPIANRLQIQELTENSSLTINNAVIR